MNFELFFLTDLSWQITHQLAGKGGGETQEYVELGLLPIQEDGGNSILVDPTGRCQVV